MSGGCWKSESMVRSPHFWPLLALGVSMLVLFVFLLPRLHLDRWQEGVYLGVPYKMILQGNFRVLRDPFLENGIHTFLIPALILKWSGSLWFVRFYFFLFSVGVLILMYFIFMRMTGVSSIFRQSIGRYLAVLGIFVVWFSIPLAVNYPFQTNGMMQGMLFFMVAFIVMDRHPNMAIFFFGCAAYSKSQFMAVFPILIVYRFFLVHQGQSWEKRILLALKECGLFFLPALLSGVVAYMVGWISSFMDFYRYAFKEVILLYKESRKIFSGILFGGASESAGIKLMPYLLGKSVVGKEITTWGFLSWIQIGFSFLCSISFFLLTSWRFWKKEKMNHVLGLASFFCLFYLVNFLQFYGYPYWYNTLPALFFNILFVLLIIDYLDQWISKRKWGYPVRDWMLIGFVCVFVIVGMNRLLFYSPFKTGVQGNSLEPYSWMR